MMKNQLANRNFLFSLLVTALMMFVVQSVGYGQVDIPDPNLRAAIETALGKASGDPITEAEMAKLTGLGARNANISILTGLEFATNLTELDLAGALVEGSVRNSNSVSDLSPLAGLTNLTLLSLANNSISDISAVTGLTNLTLLSLANNSISDISAVTGLTNLTGLRLGGNSVSDLSPLAGLTNLTGLLLDNNSISDISAVTGLTNLTELFLDNNSISDISAVTGLTNLTWLSLYNNSISDISAVTGLTNLKGLFLDNNSISDISAVTGLTNLTELFLANNSISDISAVTGLTNLTYLGLWHNSISDISAVTGLTNLTYLGLWHNSISDISAVTGLTNLTSLYLDTNSISDISPLVTNTGLGDGDTINVQGNPLNYSSFYTHIPILQSRGVTVQFDDRTPTTLLKISGTITESDNVLVVEVRDSEGQPFAGVPVTFSVTAGGGTLSATSTTTDPNGRAESTLALGSDGDTNTVSASVEGISQTVTFSDVAEEGVDIPDPNLRAAIETALGKASGDPITEAEMETLTSLDAPNANISVLTGLEHATNLTTLHLGYEFVEGSNRNSNSVSDLSPLAGLTNLTWLNLGFNSISDISAVTGLTNLTWLNLSGNSVSDLSPLAGLTNLKGLFLYNNSISDISAVTGLTNLTLLNLSGNSISDISAVTGLTNLTLLNLSGNSISDISAVTGLTNLTGLYLDNNSISDISPLVTNTGLGDGDTINVRGNPLNYSSFYTHIPTLQSRGVEIQFDDTPPAAIEFDLSVPEDISLIHVPLKVTAVDGAAKTIESVGDLYDALGGSANVNGLITYNPQTQGWNSYLGDRDRGRPSDRTLTDDLGIIASMKAPTSIRLSGAPLGTNGSSSITLQKGLNLVGVPLKDSRITKVSDLFALDGIRANVSVIIGSDAGGFKLVAQAGDAGDVEITGGQSFIMTAREMATVAITGEAWANAPGTTAAPPMALTGIQVEASTPILAVTGSIVSSVDGASLPRPLGSGFRVTIKNLSTGKADTAVTDDDSVGYQLTFVELETGRAAQIGDTLEISAQSPNPLVGVQPLRYVVTAEDVKRGHIQLGELVAYEIPAKTELLLNYPNPFNPETWIPYRLAEDANVTLTIYDLSGGVVRRLNIGHRLAAVYESRSKAVYWDGRTEFGERVASGIYFYYLSAGDYSATRKMVILK